MEDPIPHGSAGLLSREQLYHLIWSSPLKKVAFDLGVSDSHLIRVCRLLRVPRPKAGHWVRTRAGKLVEKCPLPPAPAGLPSRWMETLGKRTRSRRKPAPTTSTLPSATGASSGLHPLIKGSKRHFMSGSLFNKGTYLRPTKHLLLDLTVSEQSLEAGLGLASALITALEESGYPVAIAKAGTLLKRGSLDEYEVPVMEPRPRYPPLWRPARPTVVNVDGVFLGLSIIEMSQLQSFGEPSTTRVTEHAQNVRKPEWTDLAESRRVPIGKFRIVAYVPYFLRAWSYTWQDTRRSSLNERLPEIISDLKAAATSLQGLILQDCDLLLRSAKSQK